MAQERPPEGTGRTGAIDIQVGYGQFYVRIRIGDPLLAAGIILAGVATVATLYRRYPESVGTAVRNALAGLEANVLSMRPGSVLVYLSFRTKERLLAFIDAYVTGTVKEKFQEEFSKIGFKGELEVIVTVYDNASQMR